MEIVAHQATYRAMHQLGQWFDATLDAADFKNMPNNPTRPDGVVHQDCPHEHVDYGRQSGFDKSPDDPSGCRRTHGDAVNDRVAMQV